VSAALATGRHCLVLTVWITHLQKLAESLQAMGYDPVVLRGGMGAKSRSAALAGLHPQPVRDDRDAAATRVRPGREAIFLVAGGKAGDWDGWRGGSVYVSGHVRMTN
jgi:hypothetical protein